MKLLSALMVTGLVASGLFAQSNRTAPQPRKGSAENSLVGIALFDTGLKVVTKYGSPHEIQALTIGATGAGPSGGGDGRGGPGGGGGGGNSGGGGSSTPNSAAPPPSAGFSVPINNTDPMPGFIGNPFGLTLNQAGPQAVPSSEAGGGGSANPNSGAPGGGGRPGAGGGGGGGGGSAARVTYTRWVYKRGSSQYGFILDKFNRVVQIEAIGVNDSRVKTKRGIRFGSNFADIIKKYNAPDGYEINGDQVVVRYLVFDRVAFRMSKLSANGKHCVTGVVVAAGKT